MKISLSRKPVWRTVIAMGFIILLQEADAADYRVTPSIRLGQGWDSNIFNTTSNEESDFYFTATPELRLSAATPKISLQLTAGVEGRRYYNNPDISSWNYSEYFRLSSTDGWKLSDRFTVTPEAYYMKTSDQHQRSLYVPIDPSLPSPGIATYGLQKVSNLGASVGLRYMATRNVETGGNIYFASQKYPDPAAGSDSETYGATATARYRFGPATSLGGYLAANKSEYETTPDSKVLAVGILGDYQFSPAWKFDWRFGMSFARQDASATAPEQSTNDPAGTISLGYADDTFQANFYGNVGYSGLGGAGQLTRQGTAGFNVSDRLTERWSWSLGGYYQISRTVFAATDTDVSSLNGSAGIRYAPWEWGSFDLTGTSSRQWSDLPNNDLTRYTGVLGFTLGKTYTAF